MKIEFLSKYGIVCEYAKLIGKPCLILVSGTFASPSYWDTLDPPVDGEDGESPLSIMLSSTGMSIGTFEDLTDIDTWLSAVQQRRAEAVESGNVAFDNTRLMLAIVTKDGDILEEGLLEQFPTTYTTNKD